MRIALLRRNFQSGTGDDIFQANLARVSSFPWKKLAEMPNSRHQVATVRAA
jgi:hypothetical protein